MHGSASGRASGPGPEPEHDDRRRRPPEPSYRPERDERGRMQEAEPYAKYSVWLCPVFAVVVLVLGVWIGAAYAAEGQVGAVAATVVIATLLLLSCWLGFLQGIRALRSDRRNAARHAAWGVLPNDKQRPAP
ncbi:MAG: hypothetical protein ACTH31_07695 [Pseudoclavibacter sp.]